MATLSEHRAHNSMVAKTDPSQNIELIIASDLVITAKGRTAEQLYEHFLEMKSAVKLARSDVKENPYKKADDHQKVDNTKFYAEIFEILTSGNKAGYKSKGWWTLSVVNKYLDFQVGWEKFNGEDRPQNAETIAEMKITHANKFKAEN
jgi:hypothetical protein